MDTCKYKHIFGEEGKGFHSIRVFNIAILDVIGTVIIAIAIAYYAKFNYWVTIFVAFILGIILHRLFCVNTTINMLIFGKMSYTPPNEKCST